MFNKHYIFQSPRVKIVERNAENNIDRIWLSINNTQIGFTYQPQDSARNLELLGRPALQILHDEAVLKQDFLILGDYNCRIGQTLNPRACDTTLNSAGRNFLKFCEDFQASVLNDDGSLGDAVTRPTQVTKNDSATATLVTSRLYSTIDYAIATPDVRKQG
ncbi:hypothetical protein BCR37DRAFT_389110 [Protomyces lactucae-debilis]|uniref:Endonuclease/exonuclease/phosphatase n=1 Tax=Protomyces lactucae-debilis TaxID=2754530 RepID=A0A1Y2F1T1_PROLT|nr:uncharacterized protein BCR37DRAFT_389110 [Protomyces lactucae-debilis]ORY77831.1 hypothetical protein BCR37DRAFT_389110 [Protomyces lactucae-debilis]